MNKNTFTRIPLAQGEIERYDFGAVRLYAYRTGDPIDDEVFILEKDGQAVVLESPCFVDRNGARGAYRA